MLLPIGGKIDDSTINEIKNELIAIFATLCSEPVEKNDNVYEAKN